MAEKKIKLLHLHAPLRFGGGEVFLANFYEASGPWFENRTVLFSRSEEFLAKLGELKVPYAQFYDRDLEVGSMKKYVAVLRYAALHMLKFKSASRAYSGSDFVIGHGFPFTVIIPLFKWCGMLPGSMKTVHFQHHRLRRPGQGELWKWVYGILLGSFDLIIVDAIPVRDDIILPLPALKEKIFVIGTGLPFAKAREVAMTPSSAEPLRRIVAEKGKRLIAIYPSRYVPHKNHRIFIKILEDLRASGDEGKILIVVTGNEILASEFHAEILRKGFEDSVIFTGSLDHDDVFRAIKASDVCLFPSLEEGFGLSILESLALGIPTLAFRDAIPPELHPFLMLAESEEGFLARTKEILESPEAILSEARKTLKGAEYFDISNVLRRLYERLVSLRS